MEYQKIINLLDNTPSQPSTFRTKKWVEINDDSRGAWNTNSQIKFKNSMLKSILCDAHILVKGRITITGARENASARQGDERDKGIIFKNCAQIINSISGINNI